MTRGILIAGNESSMFTAVCAEAAKRVEKYAAAMISGVHAPVESAKHSDSEKNRFLLSWNPSSPMSARTLVLGAENHLGRIDEAIFVCSPAAVYCPAEELIPAETDKYINDQIKGWFFLLRELSISFKNRNDAAIALAVPEASLILMKDAAGRDLPTDMLGYSAAASFRAIAASFLASSGTLPYRVLGFTGFDTGAEAETAAWLFKTLDDSSKKSSGRWHKYSKMPFFKKKQNFNIT